MWYSNPQSQRESAVTQLETSTTCPQFSVLGLVVICSDNNVSVRAVTLCGLDLLLNHTVRGNDAVSAQNCPTSLSLSVYFFSAAFQAFIDLVLRLLSLFALLSP